METIKASKYAHSPVHHAVATRDHGRLRKILSSLPQLRDPSEIRTESISLAEEQKAETVSSVIDRRDVPKRDTPLHLAVKLGDETATAMLMAAGANKKLRNERGWNAVQEAIFNKKEGIAGIIVKHSPVLAWARWCRTVPRLVGTMRRMRDFYMEITFHFESSVIPFISRVAPSDTFKFWKKGANLRMDWTLDDFDSFRIQRADQSILFLGDGSEDGKFPLGTLWMISHKDKQAIRADNDAPASDAEVQRKVAKMSQSDITRLRLDVTEAVLLPQLTWRRQERTEMVGPWKAKLYDMHNLAASFESWEVSGAMMDEKSSFCSGNKAGSEEVGDPLTEEEKRQLEIALKLDSSDLGNEKGDGSVRPRDSCKNGETKQEKKGWFGGRKKGDDKRDGGKRVAPPRSSVHVEHTKISINSESGSPFKKVLRPVIWLSPNFPFQTEELLPLLDIIANRVKAIRRWRELLTTKFPTGTFPVKVAIPVVPTIRVLVTFTKFEELQPEDEFSTPGRESPATMQSSGSTWFSWIEAPYQTQSSSSTGSSSSRTENMQDPFAIPPDYKWVTAKELRKKVQEGGNQRKE